MTSQLKSILNKALSAKELLPEEALSLLKIDLQSNDMYALWAAANTLSQRQFGNQGEVYAQIGINVWPCPKSCGFCSFAEEAGVIESALEFDVEEVVSRAKDFEAGGANAIFLMTTANYPFDRYIEIAKAVRAAVSPYLPMIANIGDFGHQQARELLDAGFQGVYHVCRLGEGKDTTISIKDRLATLEAIKDSRLDLSYCVEPIGPEHRHEELVEQMFRGKQYGTPNLACMRRIPVPGTRLAKVGEISELELATVVAVTRLVAGESIKAMGVHEPSLLALQAGANQIYAETGPNPRDTKEDTAC